MSGPEFMILAIVGIASALLYWGHQPPPPGNGAAL